ncbi:hypothetical protein EK21DRAFT_99304 [Setomelanomma holmii]|uniref:ubiquitinyl hydrolase 1 n=1 Tax=Setomelanomma holmii TaxID=210430 RepID=A0A9P4HCZ4_9PLEO|nr:hypothetical protein EK21DRAFT_99304 [Setomelanomma holmii]
MAPSVGAIVFHQSHHNDGFVNETLLRTSLDKLTGGKPTGAIPLEIKAQNAGVLITQDGPSVVFESFELSSTNQQSMACKARLMRTFPGPSSKVSVLKMQDAGWKQSRSFTLAKMSNEAAAEFQPTNRANTTDPSLVTDFLMSVVAAVGDLVEVPRILKHTRDDVLSSKHAKLPWRQSSLWLLIRVALQPIFDRAADSASKPKDLYKSFGVLVLSRILDMVKHKWQTYGIDCVRTLSLKTARRPKKIQKLGPNFTLKANWQGDVRQSLTEVQNLLDANWGKAVQSQQGYIDIAHISTLRPHEDIDIALPMLDAYLPQVTSASQSATAHDIRPTSTYPDFPGDKLPSGLDLTDEDQIYRLIATEAWVQNHLTTFAGTRINNQATCGDLLCLMKAYYRSASKAYAGSPTNMSIIYLTLCELWIQCDALACRKFPLLRKYDPEVHLEELQCLSLPLRTQMERLHHVESYVQTRRSDATKTNPSAYEKVGHASSFGVKCFLLNQGSDLQELMAEVKRIAAVDHHKKCQELRGLKRQHKDLMEKYNDTLCEFEVTMSDDHDEDAVTAPRHSSTCSRCALKAEANKLSISIYEWPVDQDEDVAIATIFELKAPEAFSYWRDATYYFLATVLGYRNDAPTKPSYAFGLDEHHGLAKMLPERYRGRRIVIVSFVKSNTAKVDDISINASLEEANVCLPNALRYKLYDNDKKSRTYVDIKGKSSDELPRNCFIDLPEPSKALRRFLNRPSLAPYGLSSNEVIPSQAHTPRTKRARPTKSYTLGAFSRWPLRPSIPPASRADGLAYTAALIGDPEAFGAFIQLTQHYTKHPATLALASFALLARRILSMNSSLTVIARSLQYLAEIRKIYHEQRSELYMRTLEIALLGTSTCDVETAFFPDLVRQPNTVSALLQCSIRVKENEESLKSDAEGNRKTMHSAWRRLMYRIFPALQQQVVKDSNGLDEAILLSWATFQSGAGATWSHAKSGRLLVHFDLLTGDLMVDGLPLTCLPIAFTQHRMYDRLFGNSILEVGPSYEIGMRFAVKSTRHGYHMHFGMRQMDMLMLTTNAQTRLEILLARLVEDVLPRAFITDYIHWFDRSRNEILFRKSGNPWQSSNDVWHLKKTGVTWRFSKGTDTLIFQPLEDVDRIHVKFNTTSRTITIALPRLQLDFYILPQTNQIRSRQYRSMVIDCNQHIGTLVGLTSKLILCGDMNDDRMILIPLPREFTAESITVAKEDTSRVCAYTLDTTLLHPFTGRTGTEAALDILQSASTRSFEFLSPENVSLLLSIAKLTPGRTSHSEDTQQVHWDQNLPSSSQHPRFFILVKAMFNEAQRTMFFHPHAEFTEPKEMPVIKSHLLERDMNRTSTFMVDGYGAEVFTDRHDLHYESREMNEDPERESAGLHAPLASLRSGLFSGELKQMVMRSASNHHDMNDLKFDNKWLGDSTTHFAELRCTLHSSLPKASKKVNSFNIMLWLSAMAYSTTAQIDSIHAFATFFRLIDMATIKPPSASASFNLSQSKKDLAECPEYNLPREEGEQKGAHTRRIKRILAKNQKDAANQFFAALQKQWPRVRPSAPSAKDLKNCFKAWHNCQRFFDYLDRSLRNLCSSMRTSTTTHHAQPSQPFSLSEQHFSLGNSQVIDELNGLCRDLRMHNGRPESQANYVAALKLSLPQRSRPAMAISYHEQRKLMKPHRSFFKIIWQTVTTTLKPLILLSKKVVRRSSGSSREIAFYIQHTPRTSPLRWLKCLSREIFDFLHDSWKSIVIEYGRAITSLHRARRMAALVDTPLELAAELQNIGHSNWSPWDFPETLLLEAESGIMIRGVQETIAAQMRDSPNNENAVCQLNMGEGKSSVMVPIVAAALAEKQSLVRIIVAKPQSRQMLQVLTSKLACQECMENRGVILAQPEHILFFKLMCLEHLLIGDKSTASSLLKTQQFFDALSRDIVDESDENFSPHFELVYTMGSQQAIDFAPQRWMIIAQILRLVSKYATEVKEQNDMSVAIETHEAGNGKFPRVRILRPDATDALLSKIADHDVRAIESSRVWTDSTKHAILLVHGLIACGVLRFILSSKRWRVNFGLHPDRIPRTSLAVPYRFKDEPSPRAEFSHPDVLIAFTLLSYYYGGLNDQQMFIAFEHLSNSNQSAIEFSEWVDTASSNLPTAYRILSGINIKDRQHCIQNIFPHLRYSTACIEYFLSRSIFPKEIRQFSSKLSASGWDMGAVKANPTTGFSRTKDTMHLLPLAVKHLDLPSQSHVNALVLAYLLETSSVEMLPSKYPDRTDTEYVLTTAIDSQPDVRVILDCGAAILEQSNKQVVETWLKLTDPKQVHAEVFFHEEELSILDRDDRIESFQTSPFAKQLDACAVYLDEAHTRGIDLKLPQHYRACLTLGSSLSKDKLVQGCMRMRQLGKGQSVVFLVPEEITTKILEITKNELDEEITVRDVLVRSIIETWTDLKKSMPLWAVQGKRYISHEHLTFDANLTIEEAREFLEDEGQTLEARYRPAKDWDLKNPTIAEIMSRCHGFGAMQRDIERLEQMEAAAHGLSSHLEDLVTKGKFPSTMNQFTPAFQALRTTSAKDLCDLSEFPTDLFVTYDFMRTVKHPAGGEKASFLTDLYQRPVQWVLSVPHPNQPGVIQNLVIISPHEANKLMRLLRRKTAKVTLHAFSARTNSSYASLDALDLVTTGCHFTPGSVPRSLIAQLNLFAGSLYLRSYNEYIELCEFLGLLHGDALPSQQVSADGFVTPPKGKWGLTQSPVPLLRALLMQIRKEGEGLEKTHLGKILNGVKLDEADFRRSFDGGIMNQLSARDRLDNSERQTAGDIGAALDRDWSNVTLRSSHEQI